MMKMPTSILAAISFHAGSEALVQQAADVAAQLSAPLRLLHVDSPHERPGTITSGDRLETARLKACSSNVHCDTVTIAGNPVQAIISALQFRELLVIGGGPDARDVDSLNALTATVIWDLCRPVLVQLHDADEAHLICAYPSDLCDCNGKEAIAIAKACNVQLGVLRHKPLAAQRELPCECYYG
jgi:hypothetical protein